VRYITYMCRCPLISFEKISMTSSGAGGSASLSPPGTLGGGIVLLSQIEFEFAFAEGLVAVVLSLVVASVTVTFSPCRFTPSSTSRLLYCILLIQHEIL